MPAWMAIVAAYLVGAIPVGVILSRIHGKDPRNVGSGNIGATNVMRTAGKTTGLITLAGDIVKGLVPTLLASWYFPEPSVAASVGFAAFLGHLFPVYLKFRGGKGVATAMGVFLVLSPLSIGIGAVVFVLVLLVTRFVSLGSLVGTVCIPITMIFLPSPREYLFLSLATAILVFIKHKENIARLISGRENKIGLS